MDTIEAESPPAQCFTTNATADGLQPEPDESSDCNVVYSPACVNANLVLYDNPTSPSKTKRRLYTSEGEDMNTKAQQSRSQSDDLLVLESVTEKSEEMNDAAKRSRSDPQHPLDFGRVMQIISNKPILKSGLAFRMDDRCFDLPGGVDTFLNLSTGITLFTDLPGGLNDFSPFDKFRDLSLGLSSVDKIRDLPGGMNTFAPVDAFFPDMPVDPRASSPLDKFHDLSTGLNALPFFEELQKITQMSTDTVGQNLCQKCHSLGLEFFHLMGSSTDVHRHSDRTLVWGSFVFDADCAMCGLFTSIIPPSDYHCFDIRWASFDTFLSKQGKLDLSPSELNFTPCLAVLPASNDENLYQNQDSASGAEFTMLEILAEQSKGVILQCRKKDEQGLDVIRARLAKSGSIDYAVLQSWLGRCLEDSEHAACSQRNGQLTSLRMIDCQRREIVSAPADCAYVCLSYVWGKQPDQAAQEMHFEGSNLPVLFEDAITVTIKLGYDYLWIDRYCIPQDRQEERHNQIQNMDKIYATAEMTVIASCSPNSSVGLAGVGKEPRNQHLSATVGENVFVAVNGNYADLHHRSKWNTRGWTYQEALLSRRKLVFTEDLVYYQCRKGCEQETLDMGVSRHQSRITTKPLFSNCPSGTSPLEIWDLIETYTSKDLTFDSDILNAFVGILNQFCLRFKPRFAHVWGIPWCNSETATKYTSDDPSINFGTSLCWRVSPENERRSGFPSWSWTGWKGAIRPPDMPDESGCSISLTGDIAIASRSGDKTTLETFGRTSVDDYMPTTDSLYLRALITPISLRWDDLYAGLVWGSLKTRDGKNMHTKVDCCYSQPRKEQFHAIPVAVSLSTGASGTSFWSRPSSKLFMLLVEQQEACFQRIGSAVFSSVQPSGEYDRESSTYEHLDLNTKLRDLGFDIEMEAKEIELQ